MNTEQPFGPEFIMGGAVEIQEENFRLEIWSRQKLSDQQIDQTYRVWLRGQRRNVSRKNKLVRIQSNIGWSR
ncbi:MAG: hypothetical protein JWR69_53 [Pedosphaera sp.]|nr:hypothetical protein [Pedosphaera sp.]